MKLSNAQLLLQQQKLSPQQIQMIKLLELPTVMLEQRIKEEIEENVVVAEGAEGTAEVAAEATSEQAEAPEQTATEE